VFDQPPKYSAKTRCSPLLRTGLAWTLLKSSAEWRGRPSYELSGSWRPHEMRTVTVRFSIADDSAVACSDYRRAEDTLAFAPGQSVQVGVGN
jgi:hypothetical protein